MKYGLEIISKTGEDTSVVAVDAQGEHGEEGLSCAHARSPEVMCHLPNQCFVF